MRGRPSRGRTSSCSRADRARSGRGRRRRDWTASCCCGTPPARPGAATAPRSRAPRCGRAGPRHAAACSTGTDPRGSRSRTGRGSRRWWERSPSHLVVLSKDEADDVGESIGDFAIADIATACVHQCTEVRHLERRHRARRRRRGPSPSGCGGGSRRRCGRGQRARPRRCCSAAQSCRPPRPPARRRSSTSWRAAPARPAAGVLSLTSVK